MSARLIPVALAVALFAPLAARADSPAPTPEPAVQPAPEPAVQPAPAPEPAVTAPPAMSGGSRCHRSCAGWHRSLTPQPPSTRISFEAGGMAAGRERRIDARLAIKPAGLPRWSFGLGSYSNPATWPSPGSTSGAAGQGLSNVDGASSPVWTAGARHGYDVSVTRTFGCGGPGGLFLSARLGAAQWSLKNDAAPGAEAEPWFVTLTPEIGVQWFPFWQRTFYLRPWFGGELHLATLGSAAVGGATYPARVLTATGGLNLGFEL